MKKHDDSAGAIPGILFLAGIYCLFSLPPKEQSIAQYSEQISEISAKADYLIALDSTFRNKSLDFYELKKQLLKNPSNKAFKKMKSELYNELRSLAVEYSETLRVCKINAEYHYGSSGPHCVNFYRKQLRLPESLEVYGTVVL